MVTQRLLLLLALLSAAKISEGNENVINSMMYMPESSEKGPDPGALMPSPYDNYGAPPDHYPAIIPGPVPSDYYDNITYPGIFDDTAECQSVKNCPWIFPSGPADPYSSLVQGAVGFLGLPNPPTSGPVPDGWKCSVEADCFAQDQIPRNLSKDTEVLFLRSYTFRTIEIGNLSVLPPLMKLRIEYSDLQMIYPGAFASQAMLEMLELEGNDIEDILPSTFAELTVLKTLDISNNELSHLEQEMFAGLGNLEVLSLGSNSLVEVPNYVFFYLTKLEELSLEDNNITYIAPNAFSGLLNLKTMYLNHNLLTSVPSEALRVPPNLVNLQLSGNFIRSIARNDFRGLENLMTVWLDECEIETIAKRAFHNKKFKKLVLSHNNLKSLPNLGTLERLQSIQLDNNPWDCECDMWPTLKWLRKHGFSSGLPDPECSSPPLLRGLSALNLSLKDLCNGGLSDPATKSPDVSVLTQPYDSALSTLPEATRNAKSVDRGVSNAYDYSSGPWTYYDGETYSDKGPVLPAGGWSNVPYDTKKLYTTVEHESTAPSQPALKTRPTEVRPTFSARSTVPGNTIMARLTTLRTTAADETPQHGTGTPESATGMDHVTTAAVETHAKTTTPPTGNTDRTKQGDGSDSVETGMSTLVYIVIAVGAAAIIGVFMMVVVSKVVIYKRHTGKLKEKKSNDLKLKLSADGATNEKASGGLPVKNNNNCPNTHADQAS